MAHVLPHAGINQPPPAKGIANLKVPAAAVPPKLGVSAHGAEPVKTPFQKLLDHLTQSTKAEPSPEKGKLFKAKADVAEKPKDAKEAKDPKKGDPKSHQVEGLDASLAALVLTPAKVDLAPKAKGTDDSALAAEKAKAVPVRDRKTGAEGVPAPVTAAAAEVARSQAQQNAPRAERQEDRQKVFVVDKRTDPKDKEKLKLPGAEAAAQQPVAGAEQPGQQPKVADGKLTGNDVQVVFQTGAKGQEGFDVKAQNTPVTPRDAATFQQYLVDKGYGQLVDQARIVLKDQNAGEIRMTLYPESLGKVKVSLDLNDNTLAGKIFVENQTVKDVFQANMDGLVQAFHDGGWNTMSLEVSVGNGNGQQAGDRQAPTAQARTYDRQVTQSASVEPRAERIGSWNDRQINLTA